MDGVGDFNSKEELRWCGKLPLHLDDYLPQVTSKTPTGRVSTRRHVCTKRIVMKKEFQGRTDN